uniref:Uncharacterized protein n=1 Tax=Tanacetum cinerariifolium TaxID=118510 RepID=A0A6L2NCG8_TANCI|nr:hypothetical protein [Tanacetum cinerariifolium]
MRILSRDRVFITTGKKAKSIGTSKGTTKSKPKSTDTGNTDEPPVVNVDPKDWFKKPERPHTLDPKWNEGKSVENKPTQKWICDLSKTKKPSKTFDDLMSTPIEFSAFVMNHLQISDLTVSTDRTYTTSLTKTKAAKYNLKGIEDMFKEGDFPRLYLNDIKDMLLLVIQNKLLLAAALRMFTRRIVIQNRVEDLPLGVESYQKKLNLSKPRTHEEDLSRRSPYTTLSNP